MVNSWNRRCQVSVPCSFRQAVKKSAAGMVRLAPTTAQRKWPTFSQPRRDHSLIGGVSRSRSREQKLEIFKRYCNLLWRDSADGKSRPPLSPRVPNLRNGTRTTRPFETNFVHVVDRQIETWFKGWGCKVALGSRNVTKSGSGRSGKTAENEMESGDGIASAFSLGWKVNDCALNFSAPSLSLNKQCAGARNATALHRVTTTSKRHWSMPLQTRRVSKGVMHFRRNDLPILKDLRWAGPSGVTVTWREKFQ